MNCVEDTFKKLKGFKMCICKRVFTQGLNPGRGKTIFFSSDPPDRFRGPSSRLFRGNKGCCPGCKAAEA